MHEKNYRYFVGKGEPYLEVTVSSEDLELDDHELLAKFKIDGKANNLFAHQRDIIAHVCEKRGIDRKKYKPRQILKLLEMGKSSFAVCECGSGKEVIPRRMENPERFCSNRCPAAKAAKALKMAETNTARYGSANPWGSSDIVTKMKAKKIETYAAEQWPDRLNRIQQDTGIKNLNNKWLGHKHSYDWVCKYGHKFSQALFNGMHPTCRECNPLGSKVQREVQHFLEDQLGLKVTTNDRSIIKPYELDLVVDSKRIAIEVNGVYFHDVRAIDSGYHQMKTEAAEAAGYQLIQITDAEWIGKNELVKSRIRSILGMTTERIYARKCTIEKIDVAEARAFCQENHLQGYAGASIRFGLRFGNQLVGVMTFGKPRFYKKADYELIRLCFKQNMSVIGGSSRLMKTFIEEHGSSIMSYCDRRYSSGKVYKSLGMTEIGKSSPNYFYVNLKGECYSRYQTMKSKLPKLLPKFNADLSEAENMSMNGFWKIEDAGNLVFKM